MSTTQGYGQDIGSAQALPWNKLSESDKLERARGMIRRMENNIARLEHRIRDLEAHMAEHSHTDKDGVAVIPVANLPDPQNKFDWGYDGPSDPLKDDTYF